MKKILLLSDTHGCAEQDILRHFESADELWHAGDWGNTTLSDLMEASGKPVRAVWGNIDGQEIRMRYPKTHVFDCQGLKVCMTHIGGYPGRYSPGIPALLQAEKPGLFICGHSHILRVMRDPALGGILYMNPGAAGRHGFHHMRTMLSFSVQNGQVAQAAVIELGKRTAGILPDLQ